MAEMCPEMKILLKVGWSLEPPSGICSGEVAHWYNARTMPLSYKSEPTSRKESRGPDGRLNVTGESSISA